MDNLLLEKVLEMLGNERVVFAELIPADIDREEEKIRQSWIAEVNNRIKAVREGKSELLDFESAFMNRKPNNLTKQLIVFAEKA